MDPVSISIATTAAAAGVGALGAMYSGSAGAAAANYQAGIAQINAQIARQNAAFETQKGEAEAEQSGMKARYQIGETKAAQGASGIDVNRGSTVGVRDSMQEVAQLNEATIRNNAARKAWGFQTEAVGDEANAALDRMKASTSKTSGTIGAIGSLLGGASSVAGQWSGASLKGWQGPKFGSDSGGDWMQMFGMKDSDWDKQQKFGYSGGE